MIQGELGDDMGNGLKVDGLSDGSWSVFPAEKLSFALIMNAGL